MVDEGESTVIFAALIYVLRACATNLNPYVMFCW